MIFDHLEIAKGSPRHTGNIVKYDLKKLDAYGDPGKIDCYSTAYQLPIEVKDHISQNKGKENNWSGISGWKIVKPVWLHFDIDSFDLESSQKESKMFIEKTCNEKYGLFADDFKVWFSGSKGFHISIISKEIENMQPSENITEKIKTYCVKLASGISTIDKNVYDPVRLWRIPNTINSKSGLYKIPLLGAELWTLTIDEIKLLAKNQRSISDARKQLMKRRFDYVAS